MRAECSDFHLFVNRMNKECRDIHTAHADAESVRWQCRVCSRCYTDYGRWQYTESKSPNDGSVQIPYNGSFSPCDDSIHRLFNANVQIPNVGSKQSPYDGSIQNPYDASTQIPYDDQAMSLK